MKWFALAIALACVVPLAGWLRRNPHESPKVWMLVGVLPFGTGTFHLFMAVNSWAGWPGYVKGVEISLLDILALALYLSLPRRRQFIPFRLSMGLYLFAVLLSVLHATVPMASIFYAWQLARIFLVYAVVKKACADNRVVSALLTGLALGLCLEAGDAIWERFGRGVLQTGGTMGHQNLLGLSSHFAIFPWIALLLAGERGWRPIVGPVAGLIVAVLTVSRATLGLVGIGFVALFSISAARQWTSRKATIMAATVAAACIVVPFALASFQQRFIAQQSQVGNYDERAAFQEAAAMMVSDHPSGVGANNYIVVANSGGYNSRAGVAWDFGSDSTNVHNIYYLVAAETGYLGLATFIFMLLQPLIVAFRCGWRNRRDRRGDLLLGLGMSLFIVYIHSYFEWIFITYPAQYLFAINAGLVAGLADQLGYWRRFSLASRFGSSHVVTSVSKVAKN